MQLVALTPGFASDQHWTCDCVIRNGDRSEVEQPQPEGTAYSDLRTHY